MDDDLTPNDHRFVCEPCGDQGVSGGYDRERAEVVVCSDKGLNKKYIEKVCCYIYKYWMACIVD